MYNETLKKLSLEILFAMWKKLSISQINVLWYSDT